MADKLTMKITTLITITAFILLSCDSPTNRVQDTKPATEIDRLQKGNDSVKKLLPTRKEQGENFPEHDPVPGNDGEVRGTAKSGVHPISLHWLGWDKPGKATLTPFENGWYTITGSHKTSTENYLAIDGKIRRLSEKELEFEGTIETRTESNYGGKPCVKTGPQRFFAKGDRTYFRLQNMLNCMGERVVDYVDIYPGTSGL